MGIRGAVGGASGHSDRLFIHNRGSMQGQDEDRMWRLREYEFASNEKKELQATAFLERTLPNIYETLTLRKVRTKTMRIRRENMAAMTTKWDREPTDVHLSLATAFYTPSRVSNGIPNYGDEQLTTTVHLHRHDISSFGASYKGSVRENIALPSPLALGKPRHHHIPLLSQTESDITTVSARVPSHEGCVKEPATNPPLPSLATVHPKLPWPVIIQRSGDWERHRHRRSSKIRRMQHLTAVAECWVWWSKKWFPGWCIQRERHGSWVSLRSVDKGNELPLRELKLMQVPALERAVTVDVEKERCARASTRNLDPRSSKDRVIPATRKAPVAEGVLSSCYSPPRPNVGVFGALPLQASIFFSRMSRFTIIRRVASSYTKAILQA
ncbi:hypothetical protein EDD85DRAFT_796376 [Armillaria nabsnona]|nr:hypothetical protein EDD85DRAFT_796376 [Armillaria nabsnona]